MDPDLTLAQARTLIAEAHETGSDFDDLRDLFVALDGWLSQGGFLPEDWKRSEREAASKLRDARAALLLFGGHKAGCATRKFDRSYPELDCTCGFTDAIGVAS